jgi:hypothetical protein
MTTNIIATGRYYFVERTTAGGYRVGEWRYAKAPGLVFPNAEWADELFAGFVKKDGEHQSRDAVDEACSGIIDEYCRADEQQNASACDH